MTKKDYELIANVIATTPHDVSGDIRSDRFNLADVLALELERENPRFDRDTFLAACGF